MMRVQLLLDRFQGISEWLGPFSVVPGPVVLQTPCAFDCSINS
jgi:hypothetical protein